MERPRQHHNDGMTTNARRQSHDDESPMMKLESRRCNNNYINTPNTYLVAQASSGLGPLGWHKKLHKYTWKCLKWAMNANCIKFIFNAFFFWIKVKHVKWRGPRVERKKLSTTWLYSTELQRKHKFKPWNKTNFSSTAKLVFWEMHINFLCSSMAHGWLPSFTFWGLPQN